MTPPPTGPASAGCPVAERTTWAQRMCRRQANTDQRGNRCMSRPAELDARPRGNAPRATHAPPGYRGQPGSDAVITDQAGARRTARGGR
jgi:hypothetical protein